MFSKWLDSSYTQQVVSNAIMMLENSEGELNCVYYSSFTVALTKTETTNTQTVKYSYTLAESLFFLTP